MQYKFNGDYCTETSTLIKSSSKLIVKGTWNVVKILPLYSAILIVFFYFN